MIMKRRYMDEYPQYPLIVLVLHSLHTSDTYAIQKGYYKFEKKDIYFIFNYIKIVQ